MKKRSCSICDFYLHASVEGDYCPECLSYNHYLNGSYKIEAADKAYIKNNLPALRKIFGLSVSFQPKETIISGEFPEIIVER